MFRCESDQYGGLVFGAFDGVRTWQVNSFVTVDVVEQELVSAHEERHLRLQQGTPYGAALAVLGAAVREGRHRVEDWTTVVDACRDVHETYATYMSVAHVNAGLEALTGNFRYLEYWRTGDLLFASLNNASSGLQILEFLFHQLMAPTPVEAGAVAAESSADLMPALRLVHARSPNDRLRTVSALIRSDTRFASRLAEAVRAEQSVEANLDAVAAVLNEVGVATLTSSQQTDLSLELQEAFNAGGGEYRVTMSVRSRATSLEDQLDYIAGETIQLHRKQLPLFAGTDYLPEGTHPLTPFVRDDDEIGPHVWTVLLSAHVLRRQFRTAIEDGVYFGLLSCDREGRGGLLPEPAASLLTITETPEQVTRRLAGVGLRTLMMTTLSSLASVVNRTPFSPSEPLFVLVDERIRPFLIGLQAGPEVQWTSVAITGDRLLHAVVLTIKDGRPLHFVWVGTIYTLKPVLEWLRRSSNTFVYAGDSYPDVAAELFALLRHVVGTFATLGAS